MRILGQASGSPDGDGVANTLGIIRRRWLVAVGVLVACVGVAALKHATTAKSYQATASVAFHRGTLTDAALQVSPSFSSEPQREADTEVLVAHSPEVAAAVRRQLHLSTASKELLEQVKVEAAPNADVLNIIATTGNHVSSALLANAFAEQYIAFRGRSELAGIETAEKSLQQQISELPVGSVEQRAALQQSLQQSLQRVGELRAVAGGGANIIGLATPPLTPSGMSLSTTLAVGLLIGLAAAFSLVFLMESLDRRIKSIEEFESEYRLPALTVVPQSAFHQGDTAERAELLEPFRILRSALDAAAVTHELDTLLITSAVSGEGKTTVAADLAHAVALTGRHVVLLEFDLRRPTLARHFNIDASRGLTTVLTGAGSLDELLVAPLATLPNLTVLTAGRLPQKPSELLGSPRIAEMIAGLATDDGLVIIDAAPLNPVADTQVLLNNPAVHAVLVVAHLDQTTRDEARRARAILDRHMVEPLGLVIVGLRGGSDGYDHGAYSADSSMLDVEGHLPSVAPGVTIRG